MPSKPPVAVRPSPIQGLGAFAARTIAKGTRILEYKGERITEDEAIDLYDDELTRRHHTFLFNVGHATMIDATEGGNESRYINHSCNPNCRAVLERGRIYFYAKRAILADEELSYDYWYATDASYTDRQLRRIYPCRCGAEACRGTIAAPRKPALKPPPASGTATTRRRASRAKARQARTERARRAAYE
jgi:SET domain-containing protein